MNLVLDNIIFSIQASGGISAYWAVLISNLLNDLDISSQCLFIEPDKGYNNIFRKEIDIPPEKILKSKINLPIGIERYLSCKYHKESVFHSSYYRIVKNKNIKQVVTVHDFTYEKYYNGVTKNIHVWQKKNAIKNADVIICISENTKSDLLRFYPEVAKKEIHVIYNGVSDDYYQIAQIEKDFTYLNFLFVGSRVFYKNFKFCIDWLNTLDSSVLHIVGGALSKWEQKYLDVKLPGRYVYHGMINNHKLNELYNKSTCLLYPSLYEGFGIPVLEAMRAGCPVIALNCSSLPEVCGSAGVLVDNLSFNDFNTALNTVLTNREELIRRGVLQASSFSWDRCYNQVKIIYKRLGNCL